MSFSVSATAAPVGLEQTSGSCGADSSVWVLQCFSLIIQDQSNKQVRGEEGRHAFLCMVCAFLEEILRQHGCASMTEGVLGEYSFKFLWHHSVSRTRLRTFLSTEWTTAIVTSFWRLKSILFN